MRYLKIIRINLFLLILAVVGSYTFLNHSASAITYGVTNSNNSGSGSLRQAIIDANSTTVADVITFSVGSGAQSINLQSALSPIIYPVTIDGTTQTGYSGSPLIEIKGVNAGLNSRGLYITGDAAGSIVRGLVINGFGAQGIFIDTSNVTIRSNYVGTNIAGTQSIPNKGDGVAIFSGTSLASANNNTIGGTDASDRNLISGNLENGIGITAQVGGNANNNQILGNYIGTDIFGTSAIPNIGDGILINHADSGGGASAINNRIGSGVGTSPGGSCTGGCNLVSGNGANGIGLWHGGVSGTVIEGNYVGTNISGASAIANSNIGVEINEAPNNTLGGVVPQARNILSGNNGSGVFLTGAAATGNVVQGNYIGTNSSGLAAVPNKKMGIGIGASPGAVGANSNHIGGSLNTTPNSACNGSCNLISGNRDNGIFITGSESFGHIIEGNFIGLNTNGNSGLGNGLDGVGILDTPNTRIGGSSDSARNIIASNGSNGIIIAGNASTGNVVRRNSIGINTSGQSSGNQSSGIAVSSSTHNTFSENSIAFNGILGIDLDNNGTPNTNDASDGDTGANNIQNFPALYSAKTLNGTTKIGGQLNAAPNKSFRLEFFENDSCNAGAPLDFGEGQRYLGFQQVNTDQFGNTAFGFISPISSPGNKYISATATTTETSEFSQCILVNASKPALTNGATWYLKYGLTSGPANHTFGYGFPSHLLMCAWDANQPGVKLPTIYSSGTWYMRASFTTGKADLSFTYGNGNLYPLCGDWDGDGVDTVGVVSGGKEWYLRNTNNSGPPDTGIFQYGPVGAAPVVGDWNGDGVDTVGVVSGGNWYLRNFASSGIPDAGEFSFTSSGIPVVGDWNGDGVDTVGVVSSGGTWSIRDTNATTSSVSQFQFGFPGSTALAW